MQGGRVKIVTLLRKNMLYLNTFFSAQKKVDNHPKYLLTLDEIMPTANYDGIRKLSVISWLMDQQ
jgi:hypothetical protein